MEIKFLDVNAHPGGLYAIKAVVGGDIKMLSDAKLRPEDYELTVKKKNKKRSHDANAYYWTIVGEKPGAKKLAEALNYKITIITEGHFAKMLSESELEDKEV